MSDNTIDVKKNNLKLSVNIYLRSILAAVLGLIVYLSLSVIVSGISTKKIGYYIYQTGEDGTASVVSEVYYSDTSTDATVTAASVSSTASTVASTSAAAYGTTMSASGETQTAAGTESTLSDESAQTSVLTTESTNTASTQYIYSEVPAGTNIALDIISELFLIILLLVMPYSILWSQGDKDCNSVHFGHMDEDKLRGLKVGAVAGIPSYIAYIILLLSKLGLFLPHYFTAYRFLNISYLPLINLIIGSGVSATMDVSWINLFILFIILAIFPFVCHLSYVLGYKQISISEKIIYTDPSKKKRRKRY